MRGTSQSTLLLALVVIASVCVLMVISPAESAIVKRSFVHLGCMGKYDRAIFAKLDRVCEDCYNLYREPGLHRDCRLINYSYNLILICNYYFNAIKYCKKK